MAPAFRYEKTATNRTSLRLMAAFWTALPYPVRRVAAAAFILWALALKRLTGVSRQTALTPADRLGNLSFWGVPDVDVQQYTLRVDGLVESAREFDFRELLGYPKVERTLRMDCVGGLRNNTVMAGLRLATLLDAVAARPEAVTAIFHCADGYRTTQTLTALREMDALLVYEVNGRRVAAFGFPMRLAAPGTYGYKWAKWIVRIELVADLPKGYWESLGLPQRARVGDVW